MTDMVNWDVDEEFYNDIIENIIGELESKNDSDVEVECLGYLPESPGLMFCISNVDSIDNRYITNCTKIFEKYGAHRTTPKINFEDRYVDFRVHILPSSASSGYKRYIPVVVGLLLYGCLTHLKPERYMLW